MKLYLNGTSPFARLVRATALELDLSTIELVWVDPWSDQGELLTINPLSRVPAFADDNGDVLTETLLIVRHLIESAEHDSDLQTESIRTKTELGIAYGMMELAFAFTIHKKHCGEAGGVLQNRRQSSLRRGLEVMEAAVTANMHWSLSRLCLWIALDYIRFREVLDGAPLDHYPSLDKFHKAHQDRAALSNTAFS